MMASSVARSADDQSPPGLFVRDEILRGGVNRGMSSGRIAKNIGTMAGPGHSS
jgi:hypothetical protein